MLPSWIEAENRVLRERVFTLQTRNPIKLTQITAEIEDKECRKNIILAGILETCKFTARRQRSDEKAAILRVLTIICPETTIDDPHHIVRLGGKMDNKSRTVKVVHKSSKIARNVLKKAKHILMPGIKLMSDQTRPEQEVLDTLRKELEERRVTDDFLTIYFIRGDSKIVRERQRNTRQP